MFSSILKKIIIIFLIVANLIVFLPVKNFAVEESDDVVGTVVGGLIVLGVGIIINYYSYQSVSEECWIRIFLMDEYQDQERNDAAQGRWVTVKGRKTRCYKMPLAGSCSNTNCQPLYY